MFGIGPQEMVIIGLLVLVVFGPSKFQEADQLPVHLLGVCSEHAVRHTLNYH